jgi:tRNA 2-selenouridine synthase
MRKSKLYFIDIPFEERLNYLTIEYGIHPTEKMVNAIIRIQKRLGGLETKNAINFLIENNHKESFRILLAYYDKWYKKGLFARDNAKDLITTIKAEVVDTATNIQLLKQNL